MAKSIEQTDCQLPPPSKDCLATEQIQALLEDSVSPPESAAIEDHLSTCEHCRTQLEAEFGVPEWWSIAKESLSESSPDEFAIQDGNPHHPDWQQLLGPTDDPSKLGRIGNYEVIGLLGRGGMGVVFKAFDGALNRYVAIKMLAPHLATSGAARKRFAREAQAAAAVVDDNVLPIYGVDQWQGVPYFVMQYSRGMTLQKRIQDQGQLELKEILRIGLQTAKGLAAAHAQGLVHRDVKPSNILLDGSVERVLLSDFGLARAVDDASLTRTGTITGTPQYMSPEQIQGGAVDARCDLFSLGCVLYALCTGRPPFRAESSYAILRQITDQEPRPIRQLNAEVPEWFEAIVVKLMAKSPADRFDSAAAVAALLEQCLAHVQQPLHSSLPDQVKSLLDNNKPKTISRFARIGAAVAAVVIISFVAYFTLFGAAVPSVEGKWHDEAWGEITLTPSTPGEYDGTFSGLDGKSKGIIRLRWSRKEGRFNGTWSDGESQTGRISLRPTNGEIRGALTTVPVEGSSPADPQDKAWDITSPDPKSVPGSGPLVESGPKINRFATKQPRLGDFVWTKNKPSAHDHEVLDKTNSDFIGQWRCIRAEKLGVPVSPKEMSTNALTLSIGNKTFNLKNERNEATLACQYSLAKVTSDSTYPHHIDLESRDPIGAHTSIQGIIQLRDGLLHFAHGRGRPSSFKTSTDPELDQRAYVFERIATGGNTDLQSSQMAAPTKTAEWIRITKAETHVNYVFVDLEWAAAILPYHARTIFLGPDSPPTEADAVIAREQNRSGVRCSSTNPVSAIYNQGSEKRGTHRLFFRMPDKSTAEAALAQIKVKQIDSNKFTLPPLHSHELFSLFRVEHDGNWYQAGVDILPGRGETGKERLGLLYSFPRNMDLTAWKRLESVIHPDQKNVSVRWEPTSESAPSAKVLRLDDAPASPELEKRVLLLAQQRIALLKDELAGHAVPAYPTESPVIARATEIVPDSWFRRDPYKELSKSPENPVGHIRIALELAAWEPAQSELALSAEQRNRIAALKLMSLPSDPFGTVSETTATAREEVSAILNPEQKARLDQLVWQRLAYEGFETTVMQGLLNLSKEQKLGIRQAFVDHKQRTLLYDATLAELRQSGKADATQLATAANDRAVLGIASLKKAWDTVYLLLTEEQRQKYEKLRGPLIKSVQQASGTSSEPNDVNAKAAAQTMSRESLQHQLEQEKAKFPLYDEIMAGEKAFGEKLMVAERALFDDREAFKALNPTAANDFQQWQRDLRSMLRAKEIIPLLTKQAEHRPLMLWAGGFLAKNQFPGSYNPTLAKLREGLPEKPSEEQLLQFLGDAHRTDLTHFEGALERSKLVPTKEQQSHCHEAELLRTLQDIQTMYIDAAHSSTKIQALKKKLEEAEIPPVEKEEKPVTIEDLQEEEARQRAIERERRDPTAVLYKELQGTWVLDAWIQADGVIAKVAKSGPSIHFENKSGWLTMGIDDEPNKFTFVLDARQSPAEIDLKYAEGIYSLGLFELKNGTLSLRLADVGNDRPASMTSKEAADQNPGGSLSAKVLQYKRLEVPQPREPIGSGANGNEIRSAAPAAPGKLLPRFKASITCFNGKVDSKSSCSGTNFQPDGTLHATGKMTCGFPGRVSEIEWSFIERREAGDVYRFTRRFPLDTADVSTITKDVEFHDGRVIVFEDEFQVVVIEPPQK